jgi:hypothetical protein
MVDPQESMVVRFSTFQSTTIEDWASAKTRDELFSIAPAGKAPPRLELPKYGQRNMDLVQYDHPLQAPIFALRNQQDDQTVAAMFRDGTDGLIQHHHGALKEKMLKPFVALRAFGRLMVFSSERFLGSLRMRKFSLTISRIAVARDWDTPFGCRRSNRECCLFEV